MLGSFNTRSLALPRPMVTTGLLSSRMPLLPSGAEMIRRDIDRSIRRFLAVLLRPLDCPSVQFLELAQSGRCSVAIHCFDYWVFLSMNRCTDDPMTRLRAQP